MPEMTNIYSDDGTRQAFERSLAADIRAERHCEAEARIIAGLEEIRPAVARRCIDIPPTAVAVDGWAAFNEKIARLSADEAPITAAGVELSNASDELSLECAYYSDRCFPFSTSDRERILAENEAYSTPWAGLFEEIDGALRIRGLQELGAFVLDNPLARKSALPVDAEPGAFAAAKLASWFLFLRFHQAVKAELDRQGLVRRIPLLVGENMPGPWLEAVYYPSSTFEIVASPKSRPTVEEQKAAAARDADADIEWQVNRFVAFRALFSKEEARSDPAMAGYLRSYAAEEEDWKRRAGLVGYARSWEQSGEEFENFVAAYRYARAPDRYPPPPSPPPAPPPAARGSAWRRLFGRKSHP